MRFRIRFFHVSAARFNRSVKNVFGKAFGEYLVYTNIVSTGALMAVGDLIEQEIEYQRGQLSERYDLKRVGRMFTIGIFQGPFQHYFYHYLDEWYPNNRMRSVFNKMMADQFVLSPFCIVTFFWGVGLMEGKTNDECLTEIRQKFVPVYTMDWCIWPAAQFLNFYYLKPQHRVIYINGVTVLYNILMSYMKHSY